MMLGPPLCVTVTAVGTVCPHVLPQAPDPEVSNVVTPQLNVAPGAGVRLDGLKLLGV
jgi:hypothetical protein